MEWRLSDEKNENWLLLNLLLCLSVAPNVALAMNEARGKDVVEVGKLMLDESSGSASASAASGVEGSDDVCEVSLSRVMDEEFHRKFGIPKRVIRLLRGWNDWNNWYEGEIDTDSERSERVAGLTLQGRDLLRATINKVKRDSEFQYLSSWRNWAAERMRRGVQSFGFAASSLVRQPLVKSVIACGVGVGTNLVVNKILGGGYSKIDLVGVGLSNAILINRDRLILATDILSEYIMGVQVLTDLSLPMLRFAKAFDHWRGESLHRHRLNSCKRRLAIESIVLAKCELGSARHGQFTDRVNRRKKEILEEKANIKVSKESHNWQLKRALAQTIEIPLGCYLAYKVVGLAERGASAAASIDRRTEAQRNGKKKVHDWICDLDRKLAQRERELEQE